MKDFHSCLRSCVDYELSQSHINEEQDDVEFCVDFKSTGTLHLVLILLRGLYSEGSRRSDQPVHIFAHLMSKIGWDDYVDYKSSGLLRPTLVLWRGAPSRMRVLRVGLTWFSLIYMSCDKPRRRIFDDPSLRYRLLNDSDQNVGIHQTFKLKKTYLSTTNKPSA